ncbi:hypothetical protein NESM_000856200 [Novymonas esmeraldas]|uniref:Uncharacterized protein n=1 Tax=Novymonas esmeraldas TaxID=1808958 RepID=A0AAW0F0H6_9TRYP
MRRSLVRTTVVAVLVGAAVRGWAAPPVPEPDSVGEHRCNFDELQAQRNSSRVVRVAGPTGERSVVAAAAPWQSIRIAVFTDDV